MYRDDAEYLREWVEFHRLVGVERFFLYNNLSTDHHHDVLAPYVEEGTVVIRDWPLPFPEALVKANNHCLEEHRNDSRWIAFLDIDEFLYSPTRRPLPEVLADYEELPQLFVRWRMFGTSSHVMKPTGLVIENYVRRARTINAVGFKAIADTARTAKCVDPHRFIPFDVPGEEAHSPAFQRRRLVPASRLRINHYWTRSMQEARRKFELWQAAGGSRSWETVEAWLDLYNELPDKMITAYVPALRRAVAEREFSRVVIERHDDLA